MDVQAMLAGYIACGLWSEGCNGTYRDNHEDCPGEDCDQSLQDLGLTSEDVSFGSTDNMLTDCEAFVATCDEGRPGWDDGLDPEQVGHDFWLTRNGHGAGFWDRGLGELGDWLTGIAKPYGECSLWCGEDGRVYYQA